MHYSVLLEESIKNLDIKPDGVYIDGTFGRGGHAHAILAELSTNGRLIVFDKDPEAIEFAKKEFVEDNRVNVVHASFSSMLEYVRSLNLDGKIDGVLLDLGVSSPQIDKSERGFSFMTEGPLDMRMNPEQGEPVSEVLKSLTREELATIMQKYGEERFAWRIAGEIKKALSQEILLDTTLALANLIERSVPKREKRKHPATRCFQALRIYVNQELQELEKILADILGILAAKGKLAIISFHSLEDRIVKQFITIAVKGGDIDVPRGLPLPTNMQPTMVWKVKKLKASDSELASNIRSRSAILRVAEKI